MGLVVTVLILTVHDGVQHSTCKFTMSSGLTKLFDDVEMIHNEFKRCVFNATHAHHDGLKILQLTAVLDHGVEKDVSFEICVDLTLPADWSREKLVTHVSHLFTKSACKYAFALFHGNCLLNDTRVTPGINEVLV
jgi:hypothetical protein